MKIRPRWLARLIADWIGSPWAPCPACGKEFGVFEIRPGQLAIDCRVTCGCLSPEETRQRRVEQIVRAVLEGLSRHCVGRPPSPYCAECQRIVRRALEDGDYASYGAKP